MSYRLCFFLCALPALLGGCLSYSTADVYRPLGIPRKFVKTYEAEGVRHSVPAFDPVAWRRSQELLRRPTRYFGLQKYSGNYALPTFFDIKQSLQEYPQNPFAWTILASYLALQRQPDLAVIAAKIATANISRFKQNIEPNQWPQFQRLEIANTINHAIFENLRGQYDQAIQVLYELKPDEMEDFEKVAMLWAKAIALIGSQNGQTAVSLLRENRAILTSNLNPTSSVEFQWDNPQFDQQSRVESIFYMLLGESMLSVGDFKEGVAQLQRSIDIDQQQWDAKLARANALFNDGNFRGALAAFRIIEREAPSDLIYSADLVRFNLATTLLKLGNPSEARPFFESILASSSERARRFETELLRGMPGQIIDAYKDIPEAPIITDCRNNLAACLVQIAYSSGSVDQSLLDRAESLFQNRTIVGPSAIWTRIANILWLKGDYSNSLHAFEQGMTSSGEGSKEASNILFQLASKSANNNLRAQAYLLYLDKGANSREPDVERRVALIRQSAPLLFEPNVAEEILLHFQKRNERITDHD